MYSVLVSFEVLPLESVSLTIVILKFEMSAVSVLLKFMPQLRKSLHTLSLFSVTFQPPFMSTEYGVVHIKALPLFRMNRSNDSQSDGENCDVPSTTSGMS